MFSSFFLMLLMVFSMQQKLFESKAEREHKPLTWISENLFFPPQSGPALAGQKVGKFILPFQESIIKDALTPEGKPNKSVFIGYTRKISKSYLFAWIYTYILEHWPGAQLINMASTYGQSDIIFSSVKNQILFSELKNKYKIRKDWLENKKSFSKLQKIFNSPTANLGLVNVTALIADELSAYPDRRNLDAITSGMSLAIGGRPLVFYATNPAEFSEHWTIDYIKGLKADPQLAYYDFSADPDSKLDDLKQWGKANPFIAHYLQTKDPVYKGVFDFYKRELKKAQESKESELVFRRMQLGQSVSADAYRFVDVSKIKIADDSIYEDKTMRVALGIDLAWKWDFCAFCLVFFNEDTESVFVKPFLFLANVKERYPSQKALFEGWHNAGHIHIFNKPEIIRDKAIDIVKKFIADKKIKIEKVVSDPALAKQWRLDNEWSNIEYTWMSPRNMTGAIRYLEKTAASEKLFFIGKNPALAYHFSCALVSVKSTNFCTLYKASTYHSIDAADAVTLSVKYLSETKKKKHLTFIA